MESEGASHTITGVNSMGSATAVLEIVILAPMPESIQYPSKTLTCVLDSYCEIGPPMLLGGPVQEWSVDPPLPVELEISEDGFISGIVRFLGQSNHTIWANNSGGSAYTTLGLNILSPPPGEISWHRINSHFVLIKVSTSR